MIASPSFIKKNNDSQCDKSRLTLNYYFYYPTVSLYQTTIYSLSFIHNTERATKGTFIAEHNQLVTLLFFKTITRQFINRLNTKISKESTMIPSTLSGSHYYHLQYNFSRSLVSVYEKLTRVDKDKQISFFLLYGV